MSHAMRTARLCALGAAVTFFAAGALTGLELATGHLFLADLRADLYSAGGAILHGLDPYRPGLYAHALAVVRAGGTIGVPASSPYPPLVLLVASPLSLLPFKVAGALFVAVGMGAVVLALRLLGVRDWRCIAAACLSEPTLTGTLVGNLSPLMLLGVACAWRWRSRTRLCAIAVAATVAAKLWLWPLYVWLLITRRWRTAAFSVLLAVIGVMVAWALIGFAGIASYPHLVADDSYILAGRTGSVAGTALALGLPADVALLGGPVLAAPFLLAARRFAGASEERRAFGLVVIAALVASPIVWDHYLVVLFAPIALLAPQLSPIWFVPALVVLASGSTPHPEVWHHVPYIAVELIITMWLCSPLLRGRAFRHRSAAEMVPPQSGMMAAVNSPPAMGE